MAAATEATKAMNSLSLDPTPSVIPAAKPKTKAKKEAVVDSWEDDTSDTEPSTPSAPAGVQAGVAAPPPTPISPSDGRLGYDAQFDNDAPWLSSSSAGGGLGCSTLQGVPGPRRPEKTDAVARRMIASALGMRTPRMTEEQKAYDRSVREKERKKREEEREAERKRKEEAEKAKVAIWED